MSVRFFVGSAMAIIGIGIVGGLLTAVTAYFFGKQIVSGFAALVLSAGGYFIQWSGAIFNFFIDHLITRYSVTLQELGIMDGINTVWTAFRDVGNIALIGLFVFLAINIILGVKSFGEKRTIAKVLIIAVLLNFSLLFTKIIIDATNFVAYQFYKSAGLERTADGTKGGVADAFIAAAGIGTFADTYTGVRKLTDDKGTMIAIAFSVVAGLLMFTIVILFVYGAFQMVARSILLAFLMVISPLAFVSWLVPSSSVGAKWSEWWQTLISSAFFAPLFMITLWASMQLLQSAASVRGGATLGEFFASPTLNANAWKLIVLYCFVAGLLYASIKFASTFASSIAGYATVSQGLRNALLGTPAFASRFAVAPFLRQTAGWAGYGADKLATSRATDLRNKAAWHLLDSQTNPDRAAATRSGDLARKLEMRASAYLGGAALGAKAAGSKMNVMDTGIMKTVMKQAGVGFTGESAKGTKGYADQLKARAEAAEKTASKLGGSEDTEKKLRSDREQGEKQREAAAKNAEATKEAIKSAMEGAKTSKEAELNRVKRDEEDARLRGEAENIQQALRQTRRRVEDELAGLATQRFTVNIDGRNVTMSHKEAEDSHQVAQREHASYKDTTERDVKQIKNAILTSTANIAEDLGRKSGTVLERTIGRVQVDDFLPSANKEVGKKAAKSYRNKEKISDLRSVIASVHAESAPAAPTAPQTAPTAHH